MSEHNSNFEIHFLVYSGRTNPKWSSDESLTKEIINKIRSSEQREFKGTIPAPKLGYQGFLLISPKGSELLESFRVFNGIILGGNGSRQQAWKDAEGLEKILLDEVRKGEYANILEILGID